MAEIEEAEHGETGTLFEWLQRAARAPRDPAWVADGVVSDDWAPVSPVTGGLDAFVWTTPKEQVSRSNDLDEMRLRPRSLPREMSAEGPRLGAPEALPTPATQSEAQGGVAA